jgi:thiol:disulfide interchange protein DsbC
MRWLIGTVFFVSQAVMADATRIQNAIEGINPTIQIESVTAVEGSPFFEVTLGNGERIYTNSEGTHFVAGDLYEIGVGMVRNLTDIGRRDDRQSLLQNLNQDSLVVFAPEGEVKHRLLIFTDIDCGFCRKLHAEIDQLLENGVEVRYAGFPRAGVGSPSFDKYVSVVCAADPLDAMTEAKLGNDPKPASCENSVADQFKLGQQLGITGTPTLIFENGEMQPGYAPWPELLKRMNQSGS